VPAAAAPVRLPDYAARHWALTALLGVYAAAQMLLPCRPFLYPGHPLEQQDLLLFSWNMMLRVKTTQLRLVAVDRESGAETFVDPKDLLSPFQLRACLDTPNMVYQLAQHVASRERAAGRDVAVYIQSRQSVHGRRWQAAYDPEADFASLPRTLGAKPWALPFLERHPPDPTERTAFYRAEWDFCKREGFLPLQKHGADPDVMKRIRAWEAAYPHDSIPE
jgi:hypothetical protein